MKTTQLISIKQFCSHYDVSTTFISALQELDLIEIVITEEDEYLHARQLHEVEKMMRLHYDLHINLEGIDAISNLLKQVQDLKKENQILKNKLKTYDGF